MGIIETESPDAWFMTLYFIVQFFLKREGKVVVLSILERVAKFNKLFLCWSEMNNDPS